MTRSGLAGCTVASAAELGPALVAATSFLAHHPEATFVVALSATLDRLPVIDDARIEVRPLAELTADGPGWRHLVCTFDPAARSLPVRPRLVRALLEEHDQVLLLDPASFVLDDLRGLLPSSTGVAGWTIAPSRLGPLPPDERYDLGGEHWLALPHYSAGCMGFDRRALVFLEWWAQRAFDTPRVGQLTPTSCFDLWVDRGVATFGAEIVRDAGIGIGFWNADERVVEACGAHLCVGPDRARHLLFTGFDPTQPWLLAAHDARHPRVSLSDVPILAALCEDYCDRLARWPVHRGRGPLDPMVEAVGPLAPVLREVLHYDTLSALRGARALPPTPLDGDGGDAFRAWLLATTDTPGQVPLLAYALWCARADCQEAFPDLTHPDQRDGFLRWVEHQAPVDHPEVDWSVLVTPAPSIPPVVRVAAEPFGVDVIGYLAGQYGLGEASRRLTDALRTAGVPVSTVGFHDVDQAMLAGRRADDVLRHDIAILSLDVGQTPRVYRSLAPYLRGRHLVGYWHWEVLHCLPPHYVEAISLVDEAWTPSSFMAGIFEPHLPGRVHAMPYPLSAAPETLLSRADVGFGDDFTFLFVFDFYSTTARKNPQALIDAFRLAFDEGDGAALHLKSINGRKPPVAGELEALRWATRDRDDIVISDGVVEPAVVQSMIARCDCYVSLHRSEGVGATIGDAIAAQRPVIATAFGGSLEFMREETTHLVRTRGLARVGPLQHQVYPPQGIWADPDPRHAAELMRAVFEDQAGAATKAAAAADDLRARFSAEVTGARMRTRLEEIQHERATRGRPKVVRSAPPSGAPPIAITSFDRPRRLERVLDSLRNQTIPVQDDQVHLFQDGAVNAYSGFVRARQETIDECVGVFRHAFPGGHLHVSQWNVGPAEQTLGAETALFHDLRAPVAYFLGDDVELAPTYLAAVQAIWDAAGDDLLIGYVNGLGPTCARDGLVPLRAHALRRDHWLRLGPHLSGYHRLVLGQDYAHRPEEDIRALFRRWGVPSTATSPEVARANAALVMRTWGLTTTACLGRPTDPDVEWPTTDGHWSGPPPPPVVPTPEEIDALVADAVARAVASDRLLVGSD